MGAHAGVLPGLGATQMGALNNPYMAMMQGAAQAAGMPNVAAPAPVKEETATTDTKVQGSKAASMAAKAPRKQDREDGQKSARDFSFLVTEDSQDAGPNLQMLDSGSDDSDDSGDDEEKQTDDDGEPAFEAGSAIDQLLWRQKAVTGMETRRPGESAQQFMQRRIAGMKMLNAEAGSSSAKQLENEVDLRLMNANTAWHWGGGDHDADLSDDDETRLQLEGPSGALELTHNLDENGVAVLPPENGPPSPPSNALALYDGPGGASAATPGSAVVAYSSEKALATTKKRQIIGALAVRDSARTVPKAYEDCLSNDKLKPVESGRGFALLEKMGWKKGQGLGRANTGTTEPVAAKIKTNQGGLATREEKYGGAVAEFDADGPVLRENFSVGAGNMLAAAKASMDNEFSSIVSQTKSVQQINEDNRRMAAGITPPPAPAPAPPAAPTPTPAVPQRPAAPLAAAPHTQPSFAALRPPMPGMPPGMPPMGMPPMGMLPAMPMPGMPMPGMPPPYGMPPRMPYGAQMPFQYGMPGMPMPGMPPPPWGWR